MIVASIVIAFAKVDAIVALGLAAFGLGAGAVVHSGGSRFAFRRLQQEHERRKELDRLRSQQEERLAAFVGSEGIAASDLKPYGNAWFEGQMLQVKSSQGFLPKDTAVVVRRIEGSTALVERKS